MIKPEFSKFFINNDDEKYTTQSNCKVDLRCPFCGKIKENTVISSIINNGFHCSVCDKTRSIGERIMISLLDYLNISYIREYMFNEKKWRYDFYIQEKNCIIEVNGMQHYGNGFIFNSHPKTLNQKEVDNEKYQYAISQGIDKYIVIDARHSYFEYIVNSIVSSDLSEIYDLSSIDWNHIKKKIFTHNIVRELCDYYNSNPDITLVELEDKFQLSGKTIRDYIKIGIGLEWCEDKSIPTNHLTQEKKPKIKNIYKRKYPLLDKSKDTRNSCRPLVYIPANVFFKNARLCNENIKKFTGKEIPMSTLRYKLDRNNKDYKYITKQEFNDAFNNGFECYGQPFDEAVVEL